MTYEFINTFMLISEVIAFLVALLMTIRRPSFHFSIIAVYLGLVCVIELYGLIPTDNNIPGYIVFETLHVCLIYLFYASTIKIPWVQSLIGLLAVLFIAGGLYELHTNNWQTTIFLASTFGLSSVSIGLLAIGYIIYHTLYKSSTESQFVFWISIGFIIYYLCNLPYTVLSNILDHLQGGRMLRFIQPITGIIMYSLITVGYLWKINH